MKLRMVVGFILSLSIVVTMGADGKSTVLLHDDFAGNTEGPALSKDGQVWEVVDDKKNGARDEASLITKKPWAGFGTDLQRDQGNTMRVTVRLRIDDTANSFVEGEHLEMRLLCSSGTGEKYMYLLYIHQKQLSFSLNKEREDGSYNTTLGDKWVETALGRDSQYHTYTMELGAENTIWVYCDGNLMGEKNFSALDFATKRANSDLDFTIKRVEFVFITPKENGNKWYMDEVEVTSNPDAAVKK